MAKIDPSMTIAELGEKYPELVNFLIYEYGFHCVGCFVSEFETLAEGAQVHGIVGEDYEQMLETMEKMIDETEKKTNDVA